MLILARLIAVFSLCMIAMPGARASPFYADLSAAAGYSNPTVNGSLEASQPVMIQYGFGFTFAKTFGPFFAGITSDVRQAEQYSSVDRLVGNMRGRRWNIVSPVVGARLGKLIAKFDLQFFGDYGLLTPTSTGESVAYTGPFGARLVLLYPAYPSAIHLHMGVEAETVSFSNYRITNNNTSPAGVTNQSLSPKLAFWQLGAVISYVF